MTTIARRSSSPIAEILDWFDQGAPFGFRGLGLTPYVRIEDFMEGSTYVLRAEMPGVDPDKDIELSIDDNVLTIRGERHEEHKDKNRHEFHYGSFARSIPLPRDVKPEQVTATYHDGVLEVRVPSAIEEHKPIAVPVQRETKTVEAMATEPTTETKEEKA
jgi:HSP20 family protein